MSNVYTQRLILAAGLGGAAVPVFTVPDGTQAVFTCVQWVTGTNGGPTWATLVHSATGAKFATVQGAVAGTVAYQGWVLEGRWAFYAGEVILAGTDGALFDVIATGYLLTLP